VASVARFGQCRTCPPFHRAGVMSGCVAFESQSSCADRGRLNPGTTRTTRFLPLDVVSQSGQIVPSSQTLVSCKAPPHIQLGSTRSPLSNDTLAALQDLQDANSGNPRPSTRATAFQFCAFCFPSALVSLSYLMYRSRSDERSTIESVSPRVQGSGEPLRASRKDGIDTQRERRLRTSSLVLVAR
jgi:hypothetical protein